MKKRLDCAVWVVLVGPLLLLGPDILRGRVLFWGTPLLQFVPWRTYALTLLRQGYLPLWNPLVGMGAPLLANYQSAVLYPPNVLACIDPAWGSTLLVMLHLMLAGAGMAVLARRLGLSALGQSLAGLAFGLCGYLVARAGFFSINAAAAWLPWVLLTTERVFTVLPAASTWRARLAACLPLAVVLALQWTAGHAQTAWYTLVLMAGWALWRQVGARPQALALRLAGIAAAAVLGFSLAAPQLLPTLEYLAQSHRAGSLDADFAMTYSLWPWRLLGLLTPRAFGSPASGDFWGYGNFWEDAIYVGVLPLLLAIVALVRGCLRRDRFASLVRFLFVILVLTLVLAVGDNTPVFPWLFKYIPTFDLFQAPTRWMLLAEFSLALLAGVGASGWSKVSGKALYWSRLGTAGAGAVAGAAWLTRLVLPHVEPTLIRAVAMAGIWLFLAGVLVLIRRETASTAWKAAVIGTVLSDLVIAGVGLNPTVASDLYQGSTSLAASIQDGHRTYFPSVLEQEVKFDWAFRFDTFSALRDWRQVREVGLPNVLMLEGVPSASNFDPLQPKRYAAWMSRLERDGAPRSLLQLMDIGWLASGEPAADLPVGYVALSGGERVRVVPQARPVATAEMALEAVMDPAFDPQAAVIIEAPPDAALPAGGGSGEAALLPSPNPHRVEIQIETDGPAWLVLSDTWYPGWEARLDGETVSLWKADYLFRAVAVPAGRHTVVFHYRPLLFQVGLALAGLSMLILAWGLWPVRASPGRVASPSSAVG